LALKEDVIFKNIDKYSLPENIVGRQHITTTSAYGYPPGSRIGDQVHVFIAKKPSDLKKGMWYPVIINDRVILQPRIDSLKYGYALGYPDCCVKFFRKYNNWDKFSYLYESFRNTKGSPSFLCNPFFKDTPFSYIYHMPCSYNCPATMELAARLRREISRREPDFTRLIDDRLKMPFVVFYERKFYCFKGRINGDVLDYQDIYFPSPDPSKDTYGKYFCAADRLILKNHVLTLFRGDKVFIRLPVNPKRGPNPEYPFLIQFS